MGELKEELKHRLLCSELFMWNEIHHTWRILNAELIIYLISINGDAQEFLSKLVVAWLVDLIKGTTWKTWFILKNFKFCQLLKGLIEAVHEEDNLGLKKL